MSKWSNACEAYWWVRNHPNTEVPPLGVWVDITPQMVNPNVLTDDRTSDYKWDTQIENGWKCTFQRVTAGVKVTVAVKLVKRESVSCLVVTVY